MTTEQRIINSKKYLIGGTDAIAKLLANKYSYKKQDLVKKNFIKSDSIVLKNLNNFDLSILKDIVRTIAYGLFPYQDNYIRESLKGDDFLPFDPDYNSNYEIACSNFVQQSELEDDDKEAILKEIKGYKIEFSAQEELYRTYIDDYITDAYIIIDFIKDITIEQVKRLTILADYLNALNKAIICNEEVLKGRSKPHLKSCATIVNKGLSHLRTEIRNQLKYYIDLLDSSHQNVLEEKPSREHLLAKLFENKKALDKYLEFEKALVGRGYLSKDYIWQKTPILFIKFYNHCETRKLFRLEYRTKTKGVNFLRELFSFKDGTSIDKPTKRKKYLQTNPEYYFL